MATYPKITGLCDGVAMDGFGQSAVLWVIVGAAKYYTDNFALWKLCESFRGKNVTIAYRPPARRGYKPKILSIGEAE